MPREHAYRGDYERVAKVCGADIELGNFIQGLRSPEGTGRAASRALLREIPGFGGRTGAEDPQDWGRKYLASNGGCVYIDLDHLECCLPEVRSAHEHVAAWHAMLRIARQALFDANERLPHGQKLHVLVNNSDGLGNSYGSHLDFLVTRRAWDNLFARKMHYLLYLAAFQVSSIVYTGQGKVGSENRRGDVPFQLSQRADFLETLVGEQTTYRRPIVNARDEPLCGRAPDLARLHCIFFDNSLCHGSALLKVGTMQMMLALIEAERVDPTLILEDPVAAVHAWSHDPGLTARMPMLSGSELTAIELQQHFLEEAQRFEAIGGFEGVVPRAGEMVALWEDTLQKLAAGDLASLAPRIDWALKLHILAQALERRPQLDWRAPEMKHLDHLYGSLDPGAGLFWAWEARGAVERHVSEDEIARFEHEPPDDTRAWGRAMLLRAAGPHGVYDIDWDRIRFREPGAGYWPLLRTLEMEDPLSFTKAALGDVAGGGTSLDETLDALGASPPAFIAKAVVQMTTIRKEDEDHART